jgi:subtilisin family serine protease
MRPWSRQRTGFGLVAGVALAYGALSQLLPGDARPDLASEHGEHDHELPGHVCGLDAKKMLQRFQEAIQERGAVHTTYDYRDGGGVLAVRGQLNVGLAPEALQDGALEALAARHGLQVVRSLPGMELALLSCVGDVRAAVDALASEPLVRWAEPNVAARVALTPNDPFLPLERGARNAGIETAWDLSTGATVLVALLDTGIDPDHPDLRNRLVPGYDFVNQTTVLTDDNGHGTAMAGIIAAEGNNGEGVVGVAFDARVLPIKVADAMGVASVADVAAGIDLALQRGARVINLSMGTPVGSQALLTAVNRALAAGVVVVASAGNDPVHHEMFPAAYPGVLSASVLSDQGELGFEAVVAEGVDVGAPVEETVTTLPGDVYGFVGGSSAAAAYTSGVAALVASRDPTLTGAQIAQVLRQAQDPIAAFAGLEHVFRFGRLNPRRAVERAARAYVDVAVTSVRFTPQKPIPGQAVVATIAVENQGNVDLTSNVPVRLERIDLQGTTLEAGVAVASNLLAGKRRELRVAFTAPAAGSYRFRATASTIAGETEVADNAFSSAQVTVSATADADVRVVARSITTPDIAGGTVTMTVTVENAGTQATGPLSVEAQVTELRASSPTTAAAAAAPAGPGRAPNVTPLAPQTLASLAVGARATATFTWTIPTPAPAGIQRFDARAIALPGESRLDDNTVMIDYLVGASRPLQALYQQSNGVDIIPDAPWRVEPQRPYVPVQVFVPSKGGRTPATRLRVTRTEIKVADTATAAGTSLYVDPANGRPTAAPQGLEIVDELGVARTGVAALDLFGDTELDMNGRHDILRLPRAALGVAPAPTTPVDKFLDVKLDWEQRGVLFFGITTTRRGSHRSVMKVRFPTSGLPSLPGENHYHDVHHHTIAEWYFGSPLDLFAPRKAYGGPLQMVFESAYAMGVISAPTKQAARGRIITTDHNSFNNRTIPDPDGPDHRPPFGPQSVSQNPGVGQLEAFRNVFGQTAAEEIAFKQDIPIPKVNIPFVNQLANFLPGVPMGAHMLLYNAEHVEGPWHGGGWLVGPGNPNINVNLFPLLNEVAKQRQATQGKSFSYAAHPFGGQGWRDENFDRAYGLDPTLRTRDEVHDATNEFVVKGVEFFNGRGTRSLPTAAIDFNDLNPWANATFSRGVVGWDKGVWVGMTEWHRFIARTLEYSFVSDPETRFVRKIYQAGGSDAHGDFNFSVGRAATPLSLQMTYNVGDEAWYGVRTYCFGEDKAGATPEDRWMSAYADGNTVVTDGPLVSLSLDADRRFDSERLAWHDALQATENKDGRIGGEGALDGGYTALVRRGAGDAGFRYRYSSTEEWGPIVALNLYKTEAGNPNPTRSRGNFDQIVGVNDLALAGADQDLVQPLDLTKEGPVTKITAFAAGGFTGADPDTADMGPDDYRCYTNPVFAVPYDVSVDVASIDTATGTIPAGALEVRWTFDISMDPTSNAVDVKALDRTGASTDLATAALTRLAPRAGSGWSDRPGIKSSVCTLVNTAPITLSHDEYPQAGRVTFVVYWREAPRDAAGNPLHSIATTFEAQFVPGAKGTTAAPLTGIKTSGGGGGGGGLCALTPASTDRGAPMSASLLAIALVALLARRRRAS